MSRANVKSVNKLAKENDLHFYDTREITVPHWLILDNIIKIRTRASDDGMTSGNLY